MKTKQDPYERLTDEDEEHYDKRIADYEARLRVAATGFAASTPFPALRSAQAELAALRDMAEIFIAHPPRTRARMLMWLSAFFREPMPSNDENENKEDER